MAKFFTVEQANQLLPQVDKAIREAVSLKTHFQDAEARLKESARHIMMSGGAFVDRTEIVSRRNRREALASRLKEAIQEIHAFGCQVKDLDTGLIDFPTRFRGEEVLLCWKIGEERIEYWHRLSDGFAGRQRIDQDFLDNHEGESPYQEL